MNGDPESPDSQEGLRLFAERYLGRPLQPIELEQLQSWADNLQAERTPSPPRSGSALGDMIDRERQRTQTVIQQSRQQVDSSLRQLSQAYDAARRQTREAIDAEAAAPTPAQRPEPAALPSIEPLLELIRTELRDGIRRELGDVVQELRALRDKL